MSAEQIPTEKINAINSLCYNERADYWDRMPFASFLPEKILALHNPKAGMRVLDIGSGTGEIAKWLQDKGFDLLCIDPADEMVKRCLEKGLFVEKSTIQNFSTNEQFGLILAILSLIHVPKREMEGQLERIYNWLEKDGTFILALIEGDGEGISEKHEKYPRYFSYYKQQEVLSLTQKSFDCLFSVRTGGPISYLVYIFRKK